MSDELKAAIARVFQPIAMSAAGLRAADSSMELQTRISETALYANVPVERISAYIDGIDKFNDMRFVAIDRLCRAAAAGINIEPILADGSIIPDAPYHLLASSTLKWPPTD